MRIAVTSDLHLPKMLTEVIEGLVADMAVTERYARAHLEIAIASLVELRDSGGSVKHLRFQ
jgi:AMP nucleosidase